MVNASRTIARTFEGLEAEEVDALVRQTQIRSYPAGTTLCQEGCREDVFYILLSGQVEITVSMREGSSRRLAMVSAGGFFGEMALIDDNPRTASATCVNECTLAEISKATFRGLLERHPSVALAILKRVTLNLRKTDQATIDDLSRTNQQLRGALENLNAAQDALIARERMARDLEIAGRVQQSMLPHEFPHVSGWSIYGSMAVAREVGGDYFDVMQLEDGVIAMVLADVADKSVQASLYMAMLRTLFVAETKVGRSPRETLLAMHRGYYAAARDADTFATVLYGLLDTDRASFRYARAGHEFPILIREEKDRIEELDADGRFIGMIEDLDLAEREVRIDRGDTLLIYSDGVEDAINPDLEPYGSERFRRVARSYTGKRAKELCEQILEDIARFRGAASIQDDITLLAVKRLA